MKRTKDRLHRVMVIGATPAGIAATNKLGELGIPVTLVDTEADLDRKLSRDDWRLKSGLAFNHAHRPGLIRILRNPGIKYILPAEITGIKHSPQGFRVSLKKIRSFIDPEKCILCGRCAGICPVRTPEGETAVQFHGRQSLPGRPMIDKRRRPLCQQSCPLGVNAQGYIALTRAGRYQEALDLIRRENVLPAICGRICTHPCEASCRRGDIDAPVAIRDIKRFVADRESEPSAQPPANRRKEKIAVIGSGPSGLAAAADLAKNGYAVTMFEKEKKAGGLLRYGIGAHRLPREVLDRELAWIETLGVTFKTGHPIDVSNDIEKLRKTFDAVILTTGTWKDRRLGVPGEDADGVHGCVGFLCDFYRDGNRELNEKVAVVGDGNAAFDLARTLSRIGADVTIVSWFAEAQIPADAEEVKAAVAEGITIVDRTQVIEFKTRAGKFEALRCVPTKPGTPDANGIAWPVPVKGKKAFDLVFDRAFVAIGQQGEFTECPSPLPFDVTPRGTVEIDDGFHTRIGGVYAAGDAANGPKSVVEAMASGKAAARSVHFDFCKAAGTPEGSVAARPVRPESLDFPAIPAELPRTARTRMPECSLAHRKQGFSEVAGGFSELQVIEESGRCLQCGVCSECLQCETVCGAIGAIDHGDTEEELIEPAGLIILADPRNADLAKGEDVIRAYGRTADPDVSAMFVNGYNAAAMAVLQLGRRSNRYKGHGMAFIPPEQKLSPDIRIGVFACRCNDSLGWHEGMDRYIEQLLDRPQVVHAEILTAACTAEEASRILRTLRDKAITRLVLASCVCCPLNFACTACTDQKSRLKQALFTATGVSRSMVETSNLRGEVLRLVKSDPDAALEKFIGLMDRSVARARRLRAMAPVARNYNFAAAVIGRSESSLTSALTLADMGLDVFLFGSFDQPLRHANIHHFENAAVGSISGTIGEFEIAFENDGFSQTLQVGVVILGENSRRKIPYIHQKGLPPVTVTTREQKAGVTGIPFFYPGATSIPGLFLADPPGIQVSKRKKGAAVAIQAAAVMPRGPRQNKGHTVVVDKHHCRGCGRCMSVCPYQAITFRPNEIAGWYAVVDEALCKGCGNCASICPSSAADSPYRNQALLEQTLEELLTGSKSEKERFLNPIGALPDTVN